MGLRLVGRHFAFFRNILFHLYIYMYVSVTIIYDQYCLVAFVSHFTDIFFTRNYGLKRLDLKRETNSETTVSLLLACRVCSVYRMCILHLYLHVMHRTGEGLWSYGGFGALLQWSRNWRSLCPAATPVSQWPRLLGEMLPSLGCGGNHLTSRPATTRAQPTPLP